MRASDGGVGAAEPGALVFSKQDWLYARRQMEHIRAWWALRLDQAPADRVAACGEAWLADYGPLPCALPYGHDGPHRCYGSQGPITFGPVNVTPTPEPR